MGKNYYIVAIELSSSKISGAVGIETTEGMRILATASTLVDGFISKGIVRNVDKTSVEISNIVNQLEGKLRNVVKEDVSIKKAYISFAGLSVHSIKSKVSKNFGQYTKITKEIIDQMEYENEDTFLVPDGYIKMQVDTQEYKYDGNIDYNPIGAPTSSIECNYLNIVMKEQFYKQLCECFDYAKIEIADSLCAARLDADIMLSNDQRRDGCALVNIGADTTTISIYHNNRPRMLTVLPLGSNNITRDITNEHISPANAEEIKIIRGYKSTANNNEHIDSNTLDSIINARMGEILQNIKHQLETSGERVHYVVFTGGGSKLKNIGLLLEEYLPGYKTEIKPEPRLNLISESGANVDGVITTALYGLLKQGKENCCEVEEIVPVQPNGDNIFSQEEMSGTYNKEKESEKTETQPENKPQNHTKKHEETKGPKRKGLGLGTLFAKWIEEAMSDPDDEKTNNNNNQ